MNGVWSKDTPERYPPILFRDGGGGGGRALAREGRSRAMIVTSRRAGTFLGRIASASISLCMLDVISLVRRVRGRRDLMLIRDIPRLENRGREKNRHELARR